VFLIYLSVLLAVLVYAGLIRLAARMLGVPRLPWLACLACAILALATWAAAGRVPGPESTPWLAPAAGLLIALLAAGWVLARLGAPTAGMTVSVIRGIAVVAVASLLLLLLIMVLFMTVHGAVPE
jgi:hypothetical protein